MEKKLAPVPVWSNKNILWSRAIATAGAVSVYTPDPTGKFGGPLLDNNDAVDSDVPPNYALLTWTTYPERLQNAGISWQIYQQGTTGDDPVNGNYGTNMLMNFTNFIAPLGFLVFLKIDRLMPATKLAVSCAPVGAGIATTP